MEKNMGLNQHWKNPSFCCLLLCCSWFAQAADWCAKPELNVNGLSKHFDDTNSPPGDRRNEVNTGLGLTCALKGVGNWRDEIEGGFYKNSHFTNSFYAAYGIYYPLNSVLFAGLRNIIATGYPTDTYKTGLVAGPLPTVKLELSSAMSLNVSFVPKRNAIVLVNLGYRF
jgi:hypothetical protein